MLPVGQCDLYFTAQWFLVKTFMHQILFSFIGKAQFRRAMLSCDSFYSFKQEFILYLEVDLNELKVFHFFLAHLSL